MATKGRFKLLLTGGGVMQGIRDFKGKLAGAVSNGFEVSNSFNYCWSKSLGTIDFFSEELSIGHTNCVY